jgi:hypothetical protein
MNFLLIILFAIIFPVVHIVNGWVFKFAEVSPHIGLIYLPAFMRLANVLITSVALLNSLCSAGGPLLALSLFRLHAKRDVELTSLKDLTFLTLIYAIANAVLHHAMWSVLDPSKLVAPVQVLWMILGDILGALLGAYIMKWVIVSHRQCRLKSDLLD